MYHQQFREQKTSQFQDNTKKSRRKGIVLVIIVLLLIAISSFVYFGFPFPSTVTIDIARASTATANATIVNDAGVVAEFQEEVRNFRETSNIGGIRLTSLTQLGRNIAYATYIIDGKTPPIDPLRSVSGNKKTGYPSDFLFGPGPENNHFTAPGVGNNPGTNDTEYRILGEIANRFWDVREQATGEVRLYTEQIPCGSCSKGPIPQFRDAFPGVTLHIGWTYNDPQDKEADYKSQ